MLRGSAAIVKFTASSRHHEASEIARRIIEIASAGGALSQIGVILPKEKPYVPLLRSIFARYSIPARFHFPEKLEHQSPVRYLSALIEAALSGWDWEHILEAVNMAASGYGATAAGDELDFTIRAGLPRRGLDDLGPFGEKLRLIERWPDLHRTPEQWASALVDLSKWAFESVRIEPSDHESAMIWRRRAAALRGWREALAETAVNLPAQPTLLSDFWTEAKKVIRATPLVVHDTRANCIQVLDIREARQRTFETAFICGVLEGEFPEHEGSLIDFAATRAGKSVVFSWPRFSSEGYESLPAFALDRFPGDPVAAPESRPAPSRPFCSPKPTLRVEPAQISSLLPLEKKWRPSEIETFLECPFKYLGRYLLKLESAPPRPEDRFDAREQGSLVHALLRQLADRPAADLDLVFEQAFLAPQRKDNITATHRIVWDRLEMLRSLRTVLAAPASRQGWKAFAEWPFEFPLVEGLKVRGRIDRFEISPEGDAFATDYKYSRSATLRQRTKTDTGVQGGLYLWALHHAGYRPIGFAYVPLRGDARPIELQGAEELMSDAREKTIDAVTRITQGEIAARPANAANCRYCDFLSTCRIREVSAEIAAEAEDGE